MKWRDLWLGILFILLPGAMLAPAWRNHGLGASEDDILYYFPARVLFSEAIADGHWPLFNPLTGLGRPYLSDPQTAVFYPPTWLFAVLKPTTAYPAHLWLHYTLALWGAYRLMRGLRLRESAAVFGAIVFAFGGFMIAHRAHLSMQAAAAWTPWVLVAMQKLAIWRDRGHPRYARELFLRIGAVSWLLTLQALAGHVQVALMSVMGGIVLVVANELWQPSPAERWRRRIHRSGGAMVRVAIAGVLVAGLSCVQWLPTALYAAMCARSDWSYWDLTQNSFDPSSLILFVFPHFFGQRTPNDLFPQAYWGPSHQCEQLGYAGLLPLLLAVFALRVPWRNSRLRRPWIVLLGFGLLLALGKWGPVCPLLYALPLRTIFRCPARALLLVDLALAVLAASVVDDLVREPSPLRARLRSALLGLARDPLLHALLITLPLLLIALLIAPWIGDATRRAAAFRALNPLSTAIAAPLVTAVVSLAAIGFVSRRWKQPAWTWLLSGVVAADLALLGWTVDVPRGTPDLTKLTLPDPEYVLEDFVRDDRRIWVVTGEQDGRPGEYVDSLARCVADTNWLLGRPSLTDYGPLQPRPYVRRFQIEPWGASRKTVELLEDSSWRTSANVGWILVCDDRLPAPADATLRTTTAAGYRLYDCDTPAALVRFADATTPGAIRAEWTANYRLEVQVALAREPQRVPPHEGATELSARGANILVSLLALPGWRCRTGPRELPLAVADEMYWSVFVPENAEMPLQFEYTPPGLHVGAAISIASLGALVGLLVFWPKPRGLRPRASAPAPHNRPSAIP